MASNITAYYFPTFPYSLSATILLSYITTLFFPTLEQQSLRRRGIFTSHSWQLWDIFTTHSWLHENFKYGAGGKFSLLTVGNTDYFKYEPEGNFPYSQLAKLTISNMAPEGRESRDLGSEGVILFLRKSLPPPSKATRVPRSVSPLQQRFVSLRLLAFSKAKITLEKEEICECDGHTVHKFSQRRLTAD